MAIKSKFTRFRAYQLGTAGSSFSYFDGADFTLIEARHTEGNAASIRSELSVCKQTAIKTLHLTSWDQDHCVPSQLEEIVSLYNPRRIEYPGYDPASECGKESLRIIRSYERQKLARISTVRITPEYIASLDPAENYGYRDVVYHPKTIDPNCPNDNSTVKQFRSGSFNVLSLGDVQSSQIASWIRRHRTVSDEVDIMILAHHGADSGFTTSTFLKHTKPTVAIVSADYANKFEHPKKEIRYLLHEQKINLFTTKTGDVIVRSVNSHTTQYEVINLKANSTEVSSRYVFRSRKADFLAIPVDNIRAKIHRTNRGPR